MGENTKTHKTAKDFLSAIYDHIPQDWEEGRALNIAVSCSQGYMGERSLVMDFKTAGHALKTQGSYDEPIEIGEKLRGSPFYLFAEEEIAQGRRSDVYILQAQKQSDTTFAIGLVRGEKKETQFYKAPEHPKEEQPLARTPYEIGSGAQREDNESPGELELGLDL